MVSNHSGSSLAKIPTLSHPFLSILSTPKAIGKYLDSSVTYESLSPPVLYPLPHHTKNNNNNKLQRQDHKKTFVSYHEAAILINHHSIGGPDQVSLCYALLLNTSTV